MRLNSYMDEEPTQELKDIWDMKADADHKHTDYVCDHMNLDYVLDRFFREDSVEYEVRKIQAISSIIYNLDAMDETDRFNYLFDKYDQLEWEDIKTEYKNLEH